MPDANSSSDAELVEQFQKGNAKVLNVLVERWHKKMCHRAFWILNDTEQAKDTAQDSWRIILAKLNYLKSGKSFGSWALRITTNKALDKLRQQSRCQFKRDNERMEIAYEEDVEYFDRLLIHRNIFDAIRKLSLEHQQVLQLFYVQDYSLREIAKALEISNGTVKSRLFHAREKLKKILNITRNKQ